MGQSALYNLSKKVVHGLGLEKTIDDFLSKATNQDTLIRLHKESLYQGMFHSFCQRHEVTIGFYPVGGGANYSLLYLVARIIEEQEIANILELGAGATTLLLDSLQKNANFEITTIEDNPEWAQRIGRQTKGRIETVQKIETRHKEFTCRKYDLSCLTPDLEYDFIVIDGPNGEKRFSRIAAADIVKSHLKDQFIILFDDSDRPGEQDTINLCKEILSSKGITFFEHTVMGTASQHLLVTEKYKGVTYY